MLRKTGLDAFICKEAGVFYFLSPDPGLQNEEVWRNETGSVQGAWVPTGPSCLGCNQRSEEGDHGWACY